MAAAARFGARAGLLATAGFARALDNALDSACVDGADVPGTRGAVVTAGVADSPDFTGVTRMALGAAALSGTLVAAALAAVDA